MEYYAHSLKGKPQREWQLLETHLKNVARLGGQFADSFGAAEWASIAGLMHDIGKYSKVAPRAGAWIDRERRNYKIVNYT